MQKKKKEVCGILNIEKLRESNMTTVEQLLVILTKFVRQSFEGVVSFCFFLAFHQV